MTFCQLAKLVVLVRDKRFGATGGHYLTAVFCVSVHVCHVIGLGVALGIGA